MATSMHKPVLAHPPPAMEPVTATSGDLTLKAASMPPAAVPTPHPTQSMSYSSREASPMFSPDTLKKSENLVSLMGATATPGTVNLFAVS